MRAEIVDNSRRHNECKANINKAILFFFNAYKHEKKFEDGKIEDSSILLEASLAYTIITIEGLFSNDSEWAGFLKESDARSFFSLESCLNFINIFFQDIDCSDLKNGIPAAEWDKYEAIFKKLKDGKINELKHERKEANDGTLYQDYVLNICFKLLSVFSSKKATPNKVAAKKACQNLTKILHTQSVERFWTLRTDKVILAGDTFAEYATFFKREHYGEYQTPSETYLSALEITYLTRMVSGTVDFFNKFVARHKEEGRTFDKRLYRYILRELIDNMDISKLDFKSNSGFLIKQKPLPAEERRGVLTMLFRIREGGIHDYFLQNNDYITDTCERGRVMTREIEDSCYFFNRAVFNPENYKILHQSAEITYQKLLRNIQVLTTLGESFESYYKTFRSSSDLHLHSLLREKDPENHKPDSIEYSSQSEKEMLITEYRLSADLGMIFAALSSAIKGKEVKSLADLEYSLYLEHFIANLDVENILIKFRENIGNFLPYEIQNFLIALKEQGIEGALEEFRDNHFREEQDLYKFVEHFLATMKVVCFDMENFSVLENAVHKTIEQTVEYPLMSIRATALDIENRKSFFEDKSSSKESKSVKAAKVPNKLFNEFAKSVVYVREIFYKALKGKDELKEVRNADYTRLLSSFFKIIDFENIELHGFEGEEKMTACIFLRDMQDRIADKSFEGSSFFRDQKATQKFTTKLSKEFISSCLEKGNFIEILNSIKDDKRKRLSDKRESSNSCIQECVSKFVKTKANPKSNAKKYLIDAHGVSTILSAQLGYNFYQIMIEKNKKKLNSVTDEEVIKFGNFTKMLSLLDLSFEAEDQQEFDREEMNELLKSEDLLNEFEHEDKCLYPRGEENVPVKDEYVHNSIFGKINEIQINDQRDCGCPEKKKIKKMQDRLRDFGTIVFNEKNVEKIKSALRCCDLYEKSRKSSVALGGKMSEDEKLQDVMSRIDLPSVRLHNAAPTVEPEAKPKPKPKSKLEVKAELEEVRIELEAKPRTKSEVVSESEIRSELELGSFGSGSESEVKIRKRIILSDEMLSQLDRITEMTIREPLPERTPESESESESGSDTEKELKSKVKAIAGLKIIDQVVPDISLALEQVSKLVLVLSEYKEEGTDKDSSEGIRGEADGEGVKSCKMKQAVSDLRERASTLSERASLLERGVILKAFAHQTKGTMQNLVDSANESISLGSFMESSNKKELELNASPICNSTPNPKADTNASTNASQRLSSPCSISGKAKAQSTLRPKSEMQLLLDNKTIKWKAPTPSASLSMSAIR